MLAVLKHLDLRPLRCTWELTLACNLRCGHCGSRAGEARDDELTHAEALALVDQLTALGCRHVSLAGGEPTLRADWRDIVSRFHQQGVRASLISNGLTWSPALALQAKRAGMYRMGFSLDGLERSHNCLRQTSKGYQQVLRAFDICADFDLSTVAITCLTKANIGELESLHEVLHQHAVHIWQLQMGVPQGNMRADKSVLLDGDDVRQLLPRLARLKRLGTSPRVAIADNIGYYGDEEQELRGDGAKIPFWVGCRAGLQVLGIESNGNIKGCLSLPSKLNGRDDFVEGNVRQRSLRDIWLDKNAFRYNRQFRVTQLQGPCRDCEYGEICRGGCTWTSVAHSGSPHQFPLCYHQLSKTHANEAIDDEARPFGANTQCRAARA